MLWIVLDDEAGEDMSITISEAKNNLTKLVHNAEEGEIVQLTRHGKPVAVILSMERYQAYVGTSGRLAKALQDWHEECYSVPETDSVAFTDQELAKLRSKQPLRTFSWE